MLCFYVIELCACANVLSICLFIHVNTHLVCAWPYWRVLACCLCVPESAARRVMEHALLNDESEYTREEDRAEFILIFQLKDNTLGQLSYSNLERLTGLPVCQLSAPIVTTDTPTSAIVQAENSSCVCHMAVFTKQSSPGMIFITSIWTHCKLFHIVMKLMQCLIGSV